MKGLTVDEITAARQQLHTLRKQRDAAASCGQPVEGFSAEITAIERDLGTATTADLSEVGDYGRNSRIIATAYGSDAPFEGSSSSGSAFGQRPEGVSWEYRDGTRVPVIPT